MAAAASAPVDIVPHVTPHAEAANTSDCASALEISEENALCASSISSSAVAAPALPQYALGTDRATTVEGSVLSVGAHNDFEKADQDLSQKMFQRHVEDFECEHCGETVNGNGYTNRKTFRTISRTLSSVTLVKPP